MPRVIIADDSSTARMFIQRCLEIAGLRGSEFAEAKNGKEALISLQGKAANLVVTDLNMDVMDGAELVHQIRTQAQWNSMPIIVITSLNNPAKEKELMDLGASAVLSKPVSPSIMVKTLQNLGLRS